LLANAKSVFADGDVIFHEEDPCENVFEVLSGTIDLLKRKDGKYARRGNLSPGEVFGTPGTSYEVTLRAKGRTVIRQTDRQSNPLALQSSSKAAPPIEQSKPGLVSAFLQRLASPPDQSASSAAPASSTKPYSDLNFLRRLIDGFSNDPDRLGVRVALLSGDNTKAHTRHIISGLGNNQYFQTKGFKSAVKFDPSADPVQQHKRIAAAARRWLFLQGADILIWGHIAANEQTIHLHFVTLTNWDQQAPGAFDLETTLTLPIEFGPEFADLLRAVTLAAALPGTDTKRRARQQNLASVVEAGASALSNLPPTLSSQEQARAHMCFANALATASRPGYTSELLSPALDRYRLVLSIISETEAPFEWAFAQKHLGSILHIEGERGNNASMLNDARQSLNEAGRILSFERHPIAWAIVQNRLGLISYRTGFDDGDTRQLRQALKYFTRALKAFNKDKAPLRWAEIMSNFAQAAQVLGGHLNSKEALATAANACRAVLDVRKRSKSPLAWAATQNNLGSALFMLGKLTHNAERIRAALNAFEQALIVYKDTGSDRLATVTEKNMRRGQSVLEQLEPRNLPALDWEEYADENIENDIIKLPEPGEGLDKKDDLPSPGEGLTDDGSSNEPDWLREAV
jgi:tetratricopeptide (TPR) repeat protein